MTRIAACLALVSSLLIGCGDGARPFVIEVYSGDGSAGRIVRFDAVERLELVIEADRTQGQRFAPREPRTFDDGHVQTFVSSTGAFVLRADRSWLEGNAEIRDDGGFVAPVPLFDEAPMDDPQIRDPAVRVTFLAGEERFATSRPRALAWPLPEGGVLSVAVECVTGFESLCQSGL